ncbi:hypothetical protein [Pontibacter burrus]|uniref:Uncharacterized protein n=1 Tax=Pontibacter burrus TaxID=2704466 RepID=A0A6B3LZ32_9BACT|nr:hypothetical protein [Pontibacter burrus]NEM98687.1 hypothetical protein [Pontibacter burrus]
MNLIYVLPFLLLVGAGSGQDARNLEASIAFTPARVQHMQDTTVQAPAGKQKKRKTTRKSEVKSSKIAMKLNVKSASLIKKKDEGNIIEVVVMDSGLPLRNISELQLMGSSGSTVSLSNFQSFENVTLPFEGTVRFKSANKMGTVVYDREVRFIITEVGTWLLRIDV